MYNGQKVIDIHGHMSTPPHFRAYAYSLIALRSPGDGGLELSDELMQTALGRHLRIMDERNIDLQMISARPVAFMHWEAPFLVEKWTRVTNDIIQQHCRMYPERFVGIAQLPQNSKLDTSNCIPELERCIKELGFIGAIVNPDPGADRQTPGMDREYWFPLYEKAQEWNVPLIVHPSISHDPRVEIIPHNYQYNNVTEETLATLLLEHSDVFERFPNLKIIICHCGGALRRTLPRGAKPSGESAGGSVITGQQQRNEGAVRDLSNNLFFDTCAYDRDFLATAIKQRGVGQMLFGSEAPGTGTGVIN
ncbi:MAG: amidohydrolase family protein, partial [Deltaproteobacteria bacterium]|nr:amidohydrolase family protein [Deltaproteobacteria bacterium]